MLLLTRESIQSCAEAWKDADVELPQFDYEQVAENTRVRPEWVHFGAGNIFRGFVANAHQKLLELGKADTGIIAATSSDYELIDKIYKPHDHLTLLVLMNASGEFTKRSLAALPKLLWQTRIERRITAVWLKFLKTRAFRWPASPSQRKVIP